MLQRPGFCSAGHTVLFRLLSVFHSSLFLWLSVFSAPVAAQDTTEGSAPGRPNVLVILADDLGWRDLHCEGSTFYESPHIDSIAQRGMRFTHGYAACQVCSPSRASILLGKTPARHGITDWIGAAEGSGWKRNTRLLPATYVHQLPGEDTTLAEAFQQAGYRTFFAGKWHLGGEGSFPEDHGFDINIGGHHRGSPPGGFFAPFKNPKMNDGPQGESLPLRLGNETARFIRENRDRPFFAFLSFYSVHAPLQTRKDVWARFREKAAQQPQPDHRFLVDRTTPVRQVQDHPVYAGMVYLMDEAVGQTLAALKECGLEENTIVVFTSDNGGVSAGDGKATSNLPLRGGKGRQWEGGIREPFMICWPGKVPANRTNPTPVVGTDLYPTLLELAGLPLQPDQHVDGVSLAPLLEGQTLDPRPLFWHYPHYGNQGGEPSSIITEGDWKLIHYYEDGRNELYAIATDIGEQNDLAEQEPQRVEAMFARLRKWLEETQARKPVVNPNFDPVAYEKQKQRIATKDIENLERSAANFLKPDFQAPNDWWGSARD